MKRAWFLLALAFAPLLMSDEAGKSYVQVTLERQEGSDWRPVDPRTILQPKDKIRFRFATSFPGYLYVFNRSSDGNTEKLYPNEELANNRVEPGQSYVLPSQAGNYVVDGPPGYDITHWIVTPEPLTTLPSTSEMPRSEIVNTMIPRCREGGLRPRGGGCLDDRAGPQPPKDSPLKARNIRIDKGSDARISAPTAKPGPIIYEFRVAHQ